MHHQPTGLANSDKSGELRIGLYGLVPGGYVSMIAAMNLRPESEIRAMHSVYEQLTGGPLSLNFSRMDEWQRWFGFRQPAFTEQDIRLVVSHLKAGIRDRQRNIGSLKFANLIGNPEGFEEDLRMATALSRPKPPATKTIVVNDTSRIVPNTNTGNTAIPMGDVIKAMREAVNLNG